MAKSAAVFSAAPPAPEVTAPTPAVLPPDVPVGSVAASLRELGGAGPSLEGGKYTKGISPGKNARFELVPIDALIPDPDNPRTSAKRIMEMEASLKAEGMLQPIVARQQGRRLIVAWGHRRLAGAKQAGWTHVPVIIRTDMKDADLLVRQLMENSQRVDLDPIDEARAVRRFMRSRKIATVNEAGEKLGHHGSWVAIRPALLDLDEDEQERVNSGAMTMADGAKIARERNGTARTSKKQKAAESFPVTKRVVSAWFDIAHPLASKARARATRHGCAPLPGGIACGECWEGVIRADAVKD